MRGIRIHRSLASSAIILLLSTAAGGAFAEPVSGASASATPAAPTDSVAPANAATNDLSGPAQPPASAAPVNPDPSNVQPAAPAASAKAEEAIGSDEVPIPSPAAPAAAAPAPPNVADVDAPIAEQLRNLAGGKFDGIVGAQNRASIDAFYSSRSYAPLWIADGKPTPRAKAAIAYLGQVDADGLDPTDYPVPDFAAIADPAAAADAEIRLTASVVSYVHHAQVGRVHWSRVSGDISYEQKASEPAEVLAALAAATDLAESLAAYEPHDPAYLALKGKLAELRAGKDTSGKTPIPAGPILKVGVQDDRVPQLRERLGVLGDGGTTYDKALAAAVRKFQQEHQLAVTGTLTPATVEALNGRQPDRPIEIIIANMERWRWMPHDLGKSYVIVNLPDYTLRVIHDGKQVWTTKIVDGKPTSPTPIMTAEMKDITINPTWNIPPSIVANEYMPLLRQDPTILGRMGLNVTYNRDGTIHVSQPPGPNNALGQIRFNFPNKFLVYQHDSNEKYLFGNAMRASSHGCMRVQDPVKYAEVLLTIVRPGEGYSQERIRRMFGSVESDIHFPTVIPVHVTYQTAFVDDEGKLQFRADVYGRDRALLAILKSDERKIADTPIERKDNTVRRELLAMPDQAWGARGFQNFFARLFGTPFVAQPQPAQRRPVAQRRAEMH